MNDHGTLASLMHEVVVSEPDREPWLDLASKPIAVAALGSALADIIGDLRPTRILSWWACDEVVLAHSVAVALDVPRSVAEVELGLISVSPELPAASRVLVVATALDAYHPVAVLETILATSGHILVGIVSIDPATGVVLDRRS